MRSFFGELHELRMLNRSLALNPKAESFISCNMKASLDTKKQRSIALYGGSFDPVHGAHLEVAWTALENCDLDTVIFIPTAQSPLKKTLLKPQMQIASKCFVLPPQKSRALKSTPVS